MKDNITCRTSTARHDVTIQQLTANSRSPLMPAVLQARKLNKNYVYDLTINTRSSEQNLRSLPFYGIRLSHLCITVAVLSMQTV